MNNFKQTSVIFLSIFLIGVYSSNAQDVNDLELWSSAKFQYKHNKYWKFGLEEQLRLKNDISEIGQYFTQLTSKYELENNLGFGLGLRFIQKNDTKGKIQGYEPHFRIHFDASYKHKIKQISLKYRLRYQNKNEIGVTPSDGDFPKQHVRFKAGFDYNFKQWKLDPMVAAELFHRFVKDEENRFNKYRFTFGTEYKFKKIGKFGLFYRYEKEINSVFNFAFHIFELTYTYSLERKGDQ